MASIRLSATLQAYSAGAFARGEYSCPSLTFICTRLSLITITPELERLADRVIFGTDWPGVPSIGANIEAIRALLLIEEATAKILGENAARILGIEALEER